MKTFLIEIDIYHTDIAVEEAFAYLIGNITRKIHEKLDKINNK